MDSNTPPLTVVLMLTYNPGLFRGSWTILWVFEIASLCRGFGNFAHGAFLTQWTFLFFFEVWFVAIRRTYSSQSKPLPLPLSCKKNQDNATPWCKKMAQSLFLTVHELFSLIIICQLFSLPNSSSGRWSSCSSTQKHLNRQTWKLGKIIVVLYLIRLI